MRMLTLAIPMLVLAGCAAQAPQTARGPASGGDCFNVSMVTGYSSVDRDTVRVDAGPSRTYEIDISGPMCDQIDWTQRIALESRPGSWICVGDRVGQGEIHFRDPATRRRVSCHIEGVRRTVKAETDGGGG